MKKDADMNTDAWLISVRVDTQAGSWILIIRAENQAALPRYISVMALEYLKQTATLTAMDPPAAAEEQYLSPVSSLSILRAREVKTGKYEEVGMEGDKLRWR